MAKQCEFLANQQALAYHVARLPILRRELIEAQEEFGSSILERWRVGEPRNAYERCVHDIKQLTASL